MKASENLHANARPRMQTNQEQIILKIANQQRYTFHWLCGYPMLFGLYKDLNMFGVYFFWERNDRLNF